MGLAYQSLGEYQRAIEFLQQTLDIAREIGDRKGEALSLDYLGLAYGSLGQYQRAINFYKQAIEVKESIQGEIKVDELKASFASQQVNVYARLINLLWEDGDFEAAFNYAERARARAFLDQLANGRVDFRAGADSKLVEREQALKDEIIALRQQLIKLRNRPKDQWDTKTITEKEDKLKTLQKDYDNLIIELKIQSPEVAALKTVDVASLAEIQGFLDAETTLVEYFVTGDRTLAFIITRDSFKTVTLDVTQAAITEELKLLRDLTEDDPHPTSLKQLHQWLIAPLKPHLNTSKVGIVPHNILHYLPFAALTDGNAYLSDDYALFTIPSASVLRFLPDKRKSATGSLLALGDPVTPNLPPLVHAREEVKAISHLFKTKERIREEATESLVKSEVEQARNLHIAAHGEYNPNNPLFSTLHLTKDTQNDGQLQVNEIYGELNLTTATNLVVLSACNTKIGELSRGDEIVGLNRALLYAGTPTVIASLWSVDDRSTALLMQKFYIYLKEGMGKAEALQKAQSWLRKEYPEYSPPYFWAAFSLTGDPG